MCIRCHGSGLVECPVCKGNRNLKCYIQLTISWVNHLEDHIVERSDLPDHLIRNVSGHLAFQEVYPRVFPINHFPDEEINVASRGLVAKHSRAFPSERMHQQRHIVRIVPVTQVFYSWKDKQLDFFVYGFEHTVYAPSYPQTCCCGCSLL